jgi:hypothetical protein
MPVVQDGAPGNLKRFIHVVKKKKKKCKMPVVHAGVPGSPREEKKGMLKMSSCGKYFPGLILLEPGEKCLLYMQVFLEAQGKKGILKNESV